ncbi:SAM pointed domain-containing Ets transcription factor-like [Ornithodoros turicata]
MLKSNVSPPYTSVDSHRHQLVPSPSHSSGVASPSPMENWGMQDLGVWFEDGPKIKQEPQSAPSSPQSSCMLSNSMLDYPAVLEELVNITKNCSPPQQNQSFSRGGCNVNPQSPPGAPPAPPMQQASPRSSALSGIQNAQQPSSPTMYDDVRCQGTKTAIPAVDKVRPQGPPPAYQRVTVKTEDCAPSMAVDCCASLSADKLDQLRLLAMQQAAKDIEVACQILNISPNPYQWTTSNVQSWLVWTQQQFGYPAIRPDYFNMDGAGLCTLSEDDFRMRSPMSGDVLYAQLEIWKSAAHMTPSGSSPQRSPQQFCPEDSVFDLAGLLGQTISGGMQEAPAHTLPLNLSDGHSEGIHSDDEGSDASSDIAERCAAAVTRSPSTASHSHIHLWQFLKELLSQPQLYGSCIRWLDRSRGVFKIEDSVRVARLWGKRKNRPAMNYDKLSRSIRQYYKKGIMKKTERSQRLVYQFCTPYNC